MRENFFQLGASMNVFKIRTDADYDSKYSTELTKVVYRQSCFPTYRIFLGSSSTHHRFNLAELVTNRDANGNNLYTEWKNLMEIEYEVDGNGYFRKVKTDRFTLLIPTGPTLYYKFDKPDSLQAHAYAIKSDDVIGTERELLPEEAQVLPVRVDMGLNLTRYLEGHYKGTLLTSQHIYENPLIK
jgi:hypothetical protein